MSAAERLDLTRIADQRILGRAVTWLPEQSTCWAVIRQAAEGDGAARSELARSYLEPVRLYFATRWSTGALSGEVADAVQEVFLDCFRASGALERVRLESSFRSFLLGVTRNVALRIEERAARERDWRGPSGILEDAAAREERLSNLFDREWARSVMRRAAELQLSRARSSGEVAMRRVEILRLRFEQGLSIRDIAARWNDDAARLHHEYSHAREDFRRALLEVIGLHDGSPAEEVEREASRLMDLVAQASPARFSAESGRDTGVPSGT